MPSWYECVLAQNKCAKLQTVQRLKEKILVIYIKMDVVAVWLCLIYLPTIKSHWATITI